jgi:hypothetical protein
LCRAELDSLRGGWDGGNMSKVVDYLDLYNVEQEFPITSHNQKRKRKLNEWRNEEIRRTKQ